jgi:hypothetical protein
MQDSKGRRSAMEDEGRGSGSGEGPEASRMRFPFLQGVNELLCSVQGVES